MNLWITPFITNIVLDSPSIAKCAFKKHCKQKNMQHNTVFATMNITDIALK